MCRRAERGVNSCPANLRVGGASLFDGRLFSPRTFHAASLETVPPRHVAARARASDAPCRLPAIALAFPFPFALTFLPLTFPLTLTLVFLLPVGFIVIQWHRNRTEWALRNGERAYRHGYRSVECSNWSLPNADVLPDADFDALVCQRTGQRRGLCNQDQRKL